MIMSSLLRGLGTSVQKDLGRLKPRWLWFGVTDKCNSRCVYCNIWKMKPCPDPLTPSEIEIILSNDLFKNIQYVLNSGGEPVMRTDIKDVFAVEHKVLPDARLQLSTNGILVDSIISLVQFALEDLGCHLDVGVSLDGVGENHDSTRGIKGNFERVNRLLQVVHCIHL